jgi:hypothetical protein
MIFDISYIQPKHGDRCEFRVRRKHNRKREHTGYPVHWLHFYVYDGEIS